MSRHGFRHALDRTIRWIRDPGAIRWAPARRPSEGRILELLLSAAPNIVIAGDAVQQEWGRNLARMLMRIVVRTFPHTRARVSGDPSLQQELDSIVADIWPATRPLDAQGPEILVGGVGAPKSKAPIFVGTDHWVARVANQQLDVSSGNGASCVVAASLAASELTKLILHELLREYAGRWTGDDLELLGTFALNTCDPEGLATPSTSPNGDLGDVLVVSAGALTNALLAALLADGAITANLHILDSDILDLTNLNRYLLVGRTAALHRVPKVTWLESLATRRVRIKGERRAYVEGTESRPVVLVGADRLSARQAVQRDRHAVIVNGASEVNFVRVSVHRANSGLACLGCINPGVDPPTTEPAATIAFVSSLAGGLLAAQLYRTILSPTMRGTVFDLNALQPARQGNQNARELPAVAGCLFCSSQAASICA